MTSEHVVTTDTIYQDRIQTPAGAICHLFLHCCFKDGRFTENEIDQVAAKAIVLGLQKELNFTEEVKAYREYRDKITDEQAYVSELIRQIHPTQEMALYGWCVELTLGDNSLTAPEERLLEMIGNLLEIDTAAQGIIKMLMIQRKAVETQQFF